MTAGEGKLILDAQSVSTPTEVAENAAAGENRLYPDHDYVLSNDSAASGTWQWWSGAGWEDYPLSADGENLIVITPPPSGRVRFNSAGASTISVFRRRLGA